MPPALKVRPIPPIKAKPPAIKANQASSRQTPFFQTSPSEPTRWMGRTGWRMVKSCTQEKSSPGGEETGEGERHHQSIPCAYPQPIKAKTPVIVRNQASSRQTMKILIPSGNQPQSERGSVTRSNALSPDRVRVLITTPAILPPCCGSQNRAPSAPPEIRDPRPMPVFPIKAKTPAIKANRA